MNRGLRWAAWIGLGMLLELAVLAVLPWDSRIPVTPLEKLAGHALTPGGYVFGGLAMLFGHSLDRLPRPLGSAIATLMLAIAFLVQAAVLAFPFWALVQVARRRKRVLAA